MSLTAPSFNFTAFSAPLRSCEMDIRVCNGYTNPRICAGGVYWSSSGVGWVCSKESIESGTCFSIVAVYLVG